MSVNELPLVISASAKSKNGIKKISFFFDGKEIFSGNSDQATYFFSDLKPDGEYLVEVVAEDNDGQTERVKRSVTFSLGNTLTLVEPTSEKVMFFPAPLEVLANNTVSSIEFFFQKGNSTPIRIAGQASKTPHESGVFSSFKLTWEGDEQPEAGEYEIFAQNNTGDRSNKVKIIIP